MDPARQAVDAGYDLSAPFLFASGGVRLIQIQPTLRCNLRCAHCYSESGPDKRGELPLASLARFVTDARELGYGYVGVSGGEPFLWSALDDFLDVVSDLHFSSSVTTNGTLLSPRRAARLRGRVGLIAVSVDGPPADHAAIRGSPTAFASMQKGLSVLRDAGIPFTLAFTLTRYNADRLRWLYEFADEEGAAGVHVHPLCDFGAASVNLRGAVPDSREFRVASWLLAALIQRRGPGGPVVTMDVTRRTSLEQSCWPMLTDDIERIRSTRFSDLVPSLIVEPDGCVVPFIYGFPRSYSIGFIDRERLAEAAEAWRTVHAADVTGIVRSTFERLAAEGAEYVDWFAELLEAAGRVPS